MKWRAGVLTIVVALVAGFGFTASAGAEQIRTDMDGDGKRDLTGASPIYGKYLMVGSKLSSKKREFSFVSFPSAGVVEPYIAAKGDVNRGRGTELFVRTSQNSTVETIAVVTEARGKLIHAGTFFVDPSLSDGRGAGFRCGTVAGKPGIRAYVFALGKQGRWIRTVAMYQWRRGVLVKHGKTTRGRVSTPAASQRTIACPRPAAPPEPPAVLGSPGNRFFTGLGGVEPKSFSARQGTGRYFGFTWRGWGSARPTARGFFTTGPGVPKKRMNLTAFDLGKCSGKNAYRKLSLKAAGGRAITLNVC